MDKDYLEKAKEIYLVLHDIEEESNYIYATKKLNKAREILGNKNVKEGFSLFELLNLYRLVHTSDIFKGHEEQISKQIVGLRNIILEELNSYGYLKRG